MSLASYRAAPPRVPVVLAAVAALLRELYRRILPRRVNKYRFPVRFLKKRLARGGSVSLRQRLTADDSPLAETQNSALLGVRGKGMQSRMFAIPVIN